MLVYEYSVQTTEHYENLAHHVVEELDYGDAAEVVIGVELGECAGGEVGPALGRGGIASTNEVRIADLTVLSSSKGARD